MKRFPIGITSYHNCFNHLNHFALILLSLLLLQSGLFIRTQLNKICTFFLIYNPRWKPLSSLLWMFFESCSTRLLVSLFKLIPLALLANHSHVKTVAANVRRCLLHGRACCSCVSRGTLLLSNNLLRKHLNDLPLLPSSLNSSL